MARLFVAAWPPEEVLDMVEKLPRPAGVGVRYTRRDQWHVTLRFLGEADPDVAADAVSRVKAEPIEAVLGPEVGRLGRHVVSIPVAGLDEVASAVTDVTAGVGKPPDRRPFTGHITIARLKGRGSCGMAGTPVAARFHVREVHLVRSNLRSDGARYDTVVVQPLG